MKTFAMVLMACALGVLCCFVASGAAPLEAGNHLQPLCYPPDNRDNSILKGAGQSFAIGLSDSEPGYAWQLAPTYDPDVVQFVSSVYVLSESPGTDRECWVFSTSTPGTTTLVFNYESVRQHDPTGMPPVGTPPDGTQPVQTATFDVGIFGPPGSSTGPPPPGRPPPTQTGP
jgi:hypothetical protein